MEMYYLESQCRGLDDIDRRRLLCKLLSIPPQLLGIAFPVDGVGWWVREYPAFPVVGEVEWPNPGKVTRHFRKAKGWTQSQLAEALGLTELTVRNMEKKTQGLGSLSRRRALSFLLSIPPLLLGLDAEHIVREFGTVVGTSSKAPAPELITAFRASADTLFDAYYASTASVKDRVTNTLSWLSEAHEFASTVHGSQRSQILEAESLGYQALTNIVRESTAPDSTVLIYANRAVQLARSSRNTDLLVVALQRRAETLIDRGHFDLAQRSIAEALTSPVDDEALRDHRFVASARIRAATATDEQDRLAVFALLNQARPISTSDVYHTHGDQELVTLRTTQAYNLLAMNAPSTQAREIWQKVADLLVDLSPASSRRSYIAKIELAQAFLGLGEYDYAVQIALEALPLMDELKSTRHLPQLASMYAELRKGKLRDDPRVARLGLYLFEHPVVS